MTIKNLFRKRIIFLGLILISAVLVVKIDILYVKIEELIILAEAIISMYPIIGLLIFVLLAIASAMVAFYSSAFLVPIGVYTWGSTVCFMLLWVGWLIGGILTFAMGRYLGRPITTKIIGESRFTKFEKQVSKRAKFIHILLFQAALPSEIPGYVLGALHYRFVLYLTALALTELPYALGTVYLDSSFINRNNIVFIALAVGTVLVSVYMYFLYRRHLYMNTEF